MQRVYADRSDAGRVLAESLAGLHGTADAMVLALPRGGVPVAYEVALALGLPLDVLVVRKLGLPGQPELAMGAVASGGACVLNPDILRHLGPTQGVLESVRAREIAELARRERMYRDNRPPLEMAGRTAIVVDDGLATGATMEAAVRALRALGARQVIAAIPVGSVEALDRIADLADDVVCPSAPEAFSSVGQWFRDFEQTSDAEVRDLLSRAHARLKSEGG